MEGHPPIEPIHERGVTLQDTVKDIVYGSIAGGCGKIIEYPFDTVKVRLQSQVEVIYKGPIDCLRKSLANEGLRGLYRGVASPIVGAAAETASLFVAYNLAQQYIGDDGIVTTLACGSFSGAVTSFILTPVELVKCQMQVGSSSRTLIDQIRYIHSTTGVSGFWRGQLGTLFRECGGSAAWFGAYEYVGKLLSKSDRPKTAAESMLAGAAAGIAYNVSLFPADTIKSQIQTRPGSTEFIQTGRDIVKRGGIGALYRGCGITVCRSAPSSAIIFFTYESLKSLY